MMSQREGIIPSIDLIDGKVVRLKKGDYAQQTTYDIDALAALKAYEKDGAKRLHIVDLTGAKDPQKRQTAYIGKLVESLSVPIQVGGGVRTEEDVRRLLDAGVDRVVVGSLSVKEPLTVAHWFRLFGANRLTLALDCRVDDNGKAFVATDAWQADSDKTVENLIDYYRRAGLKNVLCTDIAKDGMLGGTNTSLYRSLCETYPDLVIEASGGIGSLADLERLRQTGVAGVIIGRAFLENQLTVKEAMQCWQSESSRA